MSVHMSAHITKITRLNNDEARNEACSGEGASVAKNENLVAAIAPNGLMIIF